MSVAWPTGVQLLVFFCSSVPVVLFDTPQGSPGVGRNTFLSSPHLCFIIVFICDLFVSRDHCLSFYFGMIRTDVGERIIGTLIRKYPREPDEIND